MTSHAFVHFISFMRVLKKPKHTAYMVFADHGGHTRTVATRRTFSTAIVATACRSPQMLFEMGSLSEVFIARVAGMWLFARMNAHMALKIMFVNGFVVTEMAVVD